VILIKNTYSLWGWKRLLLPVSYFSMHLLYPFALQVTGITRESLVYPTNPFYLWSDLKNLSRRQIFTLNNNCVNINIGFLQFHNSALEQIHHAVDCEATEPRSRALQYHSALFTHLVTAKVSTERQNSAEFV